MSGRVRVLAVVWAAVFVVQAFEPVRYCLGVAGVAGAASKATSGSLWWAIVATVMTAVIAWAWSWTHPDPPPDEPQPAPDRR